MRVKYWDELADNQKKYVVDFLNQVQNNLERIEKINSDCDDLVDKFMATVDPVGDTCNLGVENVEFFVEDQLFHQGKLEWGEKLDNYWDTSQHRIVI